MPLKIALVGRAIRYSPNSEDKDAAILEAVRKRLSEKAVEVVTIPENELHALDSVDACLMMGRSEAALQLMERLQAPVVNTPAAIRLCNQRERLMLLLEANGITVPPLRGDEGYWVKRGDGCAECAADVRYAADWAEAVRMREAMKLRGIYSVDVRAHETGDLVKCYAVRNTEFFRYYYPGDDGDWKFHDEQHQEKPRHHAFDESKLQAMADAAARLAGVEIYGGDCIIRPDGQPVLIDLNDWPSFSRCREEAADAIVQRFWAMMNEER